MIGHKRIPGRGGGVEVVVEELSTRLVAMGLDVTAYNRKTKGETGPSEYRGVHLVDVPTLDSKKLNAVVYSYLATVRAVIDRVDVIHYHALGPAASLWLAKLLGKKVVVTVHGLNYKTPKWKGFGAKYIKFGEWLTARQADEVIVLSRSIKGYFKEKYGRDVHYIPNGISMPEKVEDDSVLDRFRLRGQDFLLCVSRLVPGKGLEILIGAFRELATDALLVIAGDSEHVDDFKEGLFERASGDERIVFTGNLGKDDLAALYANARLFVFPSEAEGMPMALLEAMWFKCPCLVSDIPENTEVMGGHGWTFRTGNEDDLRRSLNAFINRWPIREDTRTLMTEIHEWRKIADDTVCIYRKVLA